MPVDVLIGVAFGVIVSAPPVIIPLKDLIGYAPQPERTHA